MSPPFILLSRLFITKFLIPRFSTPGGTTAHLNTLMNSPYGDIIKCMVHGGNLSEHRGTVPVMGHAIMLTEKFSQVLPVKI